MKIQRTPIASAVALLLMGAFSAQAQQAVPAPAPAASAPAARPPTTKLETVVVTGIRGALEQSLNQKRNADSVVEVITAEDIGKMPDKNVADSLQRVPGVTISSASASEGGFDENDRVSLRGTNPSLTQTTINGHMVSSGDWFVLNQAFHEKRHLRRDGQEMLGYSQISPTSAIVTGSGGPAGSPTGPHPDLANVWYPNAIGSALFEQVRERTGGLIDVQIKPLDSL